MLHLLISRNRDLKELEEAGFNIRIHNGFVVVSDVPYVNSERKIQHGSLVSELTLAGDQTVKPQTHVIHFIGSEPCNKDGSPIVQIQHQKQRKVLAAGLEVHFSFSNKPAGGYSDYFEKIDRYAEIISAPAQSLDPLVTAKSFGVARSDVEDSALVYSDTNSSRAEICAISEKVKGQTISIVGLGGTGAYVLDSVAKTEVRRIKIFDPDEFLSHNAFRSPGAASLEQLRKKEKKVHYLSEIYSNMHSGIEAFDVAVTSENLDLLEDCDFVFVCVDNGSAREQILKGLIAKGIPFTDVGMGVQVVDEQLLGIVRTTAACEEKSDHVESRVTFQDTADDAYSTNVQIAELNMLNAAYAVVKWKKMEGIYHDTSKEMHSLYTINTNTIVGEDEM